MVDKDWLFDQYWNQEKSMPQIAKECDMSKSGIRYQMVKNNIPRRSTSEANKIACNNPEFRKKISDLKKGSKNHWWNGGRTKNYGYWKIHKPDYHKTDVNGYVYEHILFMEEILRRYLKDDELVHHINLDKSDNKKENLLLSNKTEHGIIHKSANSIMRKWFCEQVNKGKIMFNKEKNRYEVIE